MHTCIYSTQLGPWFSLQLYTEQTTLELKLGGGAGITMQIRVWSNKLLIPILSFKHLPCTTSFIISPILSSIVMTHYSGRNRLQTVNYVSQLLLWLISCLLLWSSHCVHPFQEASFFCENTDILYPPMINQNLWPVLFLLLYSKVMKFAPMWHPSHSILSRLQNGVKKIVYILTCLSYLPSPTPRYILSVRPCVCVACVRACVRVRVCVCVWCVCVREREREKRERYNIITIYIIFVVVVEVLMYIIVWSCKARCAQPCQRHAVL